MLPPDGCRPADCLPSITVRLGRCHPQGPISTQSSGSRGAPPEPPDPSDRDQLWVADLTYVAILAGFACVAVILDAWSRRVVGYSIGRSIDARLALAALRAAIASRRPPPGCVHHSDRGSQYDTEAYRTLLATYGLLSSLGRHGNQYDNAKAESFMKTLKVEAVYPMTHENFENAAAYLSHFIEDVYNARRLHSALGDPSPMRFEAQHARASVKAAA